MRLCACGRGWRLEPRETERKVCEGRPRINKRLGVGHDERVIAALGTPIPSSYDLLMRPCVRSSAPQEAVAVYSSIHLFPDSNTVFLTFSHRRDDINNNPDVDRPKHDRGPTSEVSEIG